MLYKSQTHYCNSEAKLPILLMEACDESLCRFLEQLVGPLPYHTQLNIGHDSLALSSTHPLKAIAVNCLKGKERERPSAQQLSNRLSELKGGPQYAESMQQAQSGEENGHEVGSLRRQVRDLQQEKLEQQQEIEHLRQQNHDQQQQLQGQWVLTMAKERENQLLRNMVEEKGKEIRTKERELQASEQLVAQFQQSMEQKDRKIRDLQHTISAHERNIQHREQQLRASSGQLQQLAVIAEIRPATATAAEKDITKLRWKEGKRAPDRMRRGAAVVDGNTIYINSVDSHKVYSSQMISEGLLWSTLPDSRYTRFSFAIIDGLLTCVGGLDVACINTLHSLTEERGKKQWSEVFPPMPTARSSTASVTTEQALVVAGGVDGRKNLYTVEVMTIATKQWTTAQHLPHPFGSISGTICGDQLYLGGGFLGYGEVSKSVLTCSLTDLLPPQSLGVRLHTLSLATKPGVWREIKNLPVTLSTLITLGGHLLAIGGETDSFFFSNPSADVHCYDPKTDSWYVITKMKKKRYQSLSAVLPEDQFLVVGGWGSETSIEIGSLPLNG